MTHEERKPQKGVRTFRACAGLASGGAGRAMQLPESLSHAVGVSLRQSHHGRCPLSGRNGSALGLPHARSLAGDTLGEAWPWQGHTGGHLSICSLQQEI